MVSDLPILHCKRKPARRVERSVVWLFNRIGDAYIGIPSPISACCSDGSFCEWIYLYERIKKWTYQAWWQLCFYFTCLKNLHIVVQAKKIAGAQHRSNKTARSLGLWMSSPGCTVKWWCFKTDKTDKGNRKGEVLGLWSKRKWLDLLQLLLLSCKLSRTGQSAVKATSLEFVQVVVAKLWQLYTVGSAQKTISWAKKPQNPQSSIYYNKLGCGTTEIDPLIRRWINFVHAVGHGESINEKCTSAFFEANPYDSQDAYCSSNQKAVCSL